MRKLIFIKKNLIIFVNEAIVMLYFLVEVLQYNYKRRLYNQVK